MWETPENFCLNTEQSKRRHKLACTIYGATANYVFSLFNCLSQVIFLFFH